MKRNVSPGPDKISKEDIIKLYPFIGAKMVDTTNKILETSQFPAELKISKIIPIYKKKGKLKM